ncbi:MAG: Uma2 family endonuclease [Cyclobacteriaceae bacterium]
MSHSIESPPKTIMEAYKCLPEGTLAELIDNVIYMSPSPVYKHQKTLQIILQKLFIEIVDKNRGEVIAAPFDVYLDESANAVQPDLTVILNENLSILDKSGHIHGVPDLLIEILSPGNKEHDLIKKKDLYERFKVKEYWIVDPDSKLTLGYSLSKDKYQLIHEEVGHFASKLIDFEFTF